MKTQIIKVKDGLFLAAQKPAKQQPVEKRIELGTHHIFVIDCSGSMYSSLAQIRRDMVNKISTMLKPNDSMSLIWFSGRGQYGVILEDYRIDKAENIETARRLINDHLVARGLTSFVGPLEEAGEIIKRFVKPDGMVHSLFFLTDGYDNQHGREEIMAAVSKVKEHFSAATMVEYGWYCNRKLLVRMATEFGGTHQFSEGFKDYEPLVTRQFSMLSNVKRSYMELEYPSFMEYAFTVENGTINMYNTEKGGVFMQVNDDTELFYLIDNVPVGVEVIDTRADDLPKNLLGGLYAAANLASKNMQYGMMDDLVKRIGDARLISVSANTFGTQKITELENEFEQCALDDALRYSYGYDPDLAPDSNAFCFFDMLDALQSSEENVWYPRHELFEYERTSMKKVSAATKLTDEEKNKIKKVIDSGDLSGATAMMEEISKGKAELTFEYAETNPASQFNKLAWNSKRANLSVQVTYKGSVALPENDFGIPQDFETTITRNYTIVKDGIIHTYVLPVSLCEETFNLLQSNGMLPGESYESGKIYKLDFSALPVVNRDMVNDRPSAKRLAELTYELTGLKAYSSVMNYYRNRHSVHKVKGFAELYGAEGSEWLDGLGLKSYGFNPKTVAEKVGEEFMVPSLDVKIMKASLPSGKKEIEKVHEKLELGRELTAREKWFVKAINDYEDFRSLTEGVADDMMIEWIDSKYKQMDARRRGAISEVARIKFMITVGKLWFKEFSSREENMLAVEVDGSKFDFKFDDSESKVTL